MFGMFAENAAAAGINVQMFKRKVGRESVTRVPFLYSLTLFGMQPVVVGVRTRGVCDQWILDNSVIT